MSNNTFFHSGDIGDIIACLPTIRQLGGGHLIIGDTLQASGCRESMRGNRFEILRPLLEAQSYIHSVKYQDYAGSACQYDFSTFRFFNRERKLDLARWQALHCGIIDLDVSPWLKVNPCPLSNGKLVCARSQRYNTASFPWKHMMHPYSDRAIFIGIESEFIAFRAMFNQAITWHQTDNMLKVAEVIAGSDMFIGNQSAPMWIAMALGHMLIQETFSPEPNSVIIRPNAAFIAG